MNKIIIPLDQTLEDTKKVIKNLLNCNDSDIIINEELGEIYLKNIMKSDFIFNKFRVLKINNESIYKDIDLTKCEWGIHQKDILNLYNLKDPKFDLDHLNKYAHFYKEFKEDFPYLTAIPCLITRDQVNPNDRKDIYKSVLVYSIKVYYKGFLIAERFHDYLRTTLSYELLKKIKKSFNKDESYFEEDLFRMIWYNSFEKF
jgi:hypothetical protein